LTIGRKIAEGREAEVYAWEGDAVLKLYRPGFLGHVAEASSLATLESGGVAPRLLGAVEIDGRHGLILERLDGSDMLTVLERRAWRLLGLARILAEAHVLVNSVQAPTDLPDLKQTLATRIAAGVKAPEVRDFALRVLDSLPAGDRLCHGDLHPGNVLVASGRASVIDWVNATRGVPEADHARTLLLLKRADPLPGTSPLFRGLMSVGRDVYARAYAAAYRKRSLKPLTQVRSWTIVHSAARLTEGIQVEERQLLAFLHGAQKAAR
jgi:aminoglycoside phosphotransferase (APT) family kinase protein